MVKDRKLLEEFNKKQIQSEKPDYFRALAIFEEMWKEGILLGVLPLKDPLEGIEVDIRIAGILNHVRGSHLLKSRNERK
jgi:hypothetical protein